jgi:Protochlamydia outer membrane protein
MQTRGNMRKLLMTLTAFVLGGAQAMAMPGSGCSTCRPPQAISPLCPWGTTPWPPNLRLVATAGYRQDDFRWRVTGPFRHFRVSSELKWKELRIAQVGGFASYVTPLNYAFRLSGDYGRIYHGKNKDSDFIDIHRHHHEESIEFARSVSKANKGHVYDLSGGFGYRFTSNCFRCIVTPYLGYAFSEQHLRMTHGRLIFDLITSVAPGPISGLNSRYKAHWFGPWLGIDFEARVDCCVFVFGGFEWHVNRYRASGRWNLRSDILGDFRQRAWGHGYIATLGADWEICNNWSIGITGNYINFRSGNGSDHGRFVDENGLLIPSRVKFNGAKWHSFNISGLIAWRF